MSAQTSLSRQAVREYDRRAIAGGIPGTTLMENAAAGATELLLHREVKGPVAIVCGKGNNGGDGFVIARLLAARQIPASIFLACDSSELKGDAASAFGRLTADILVSPIDPASWTNFIANLRGADWIVDALLGTGTKGEIGGLFAQIIDAINASGRPVLAIDLPSGLDADRGEPLPRGESESGSASRPTSDEPCTVRATMTATFVAPKRGFENPASSAYTGEVAVVDIGAGPVPEDLWSL